MQFGGSGVHTFQNDNGELFEKITVMMVMPGITLLVTLMVIALLLTGVADAQAALLTIVAVITSPDTRSAIINCALLVPTFIPFFFH